MIQLLKVYSFDLNLVYGMTPLINVVNANLLVLKYCDFLNIFSLLLVVKFVFSSKGCCFKWNRRILCDFSGTRPDLQRVLHIYLGKHSTLLSKTV